VLQYEPKDLTISVEAGMRWRDLETLLATNRQMIPLDPWHEDSTVGGVIAANISGPRRRLFGTARDMVIGMRFATLEGKVVSTGGMVVKNVAGIDFAKLMIGSFGTLAAIASVNFKLIPIPETSRTFVFEYPSASKAAARASEILRGQLQPAAIDLFKDGETLLLIQASGSQALVQRYQKELPGGSVFEGAEEARIWSGARAVPFTGPTVARVSCKLSDVIHALESAPGKALARAGNGVVYAQFDSPEEATKWISRFPTGVLEIAGADCPPEARWPNPGNGFATMQHLKRTFDPQGLLNRGRLYGRI
jgi:glycolate oxidase FAD binding subunit